MIRKLIKNALDSLNILIGEEDCMHKILEASSIISKAIKNGNKLMICGNGGSAADAQHLAGEFVCKFLKNRKPLPAIALTTDTSVLTSISNDYSYAEVFSRQVRAIGKRRDVLLGISTSGKSENVLNAFVEANKNSIQTILLTGDIKSLGMRSIDAIIRVQSRDTPRIQEMHLLIEHIIAELVERELCKDD